MHFQWPLPPRTHHRDVESAIGTAPLRTRSNPQPSTSQLVLPQKKAHIRSPSIPPRTAGPPEATLPPVPSHDAHTRQISLSAPTRVRPSTPVDPAAGVKSGVLVSNATKPAQSPLVGGYAARRDASLLPPLMARPPASRKTGATLPLPRVMRANSGTVRPLPAIPLPQTARTPLTAGSPTPPQPRAYMAGAPLRPTVSTPSADPPTTHIRRPSTENSDESTRRNLPKLPPPLPRTASDAAKEEQLLQPPPPPYQRRDPSPPRPTPLALATSPEPSPTSSSPDIIMFSAEAFNQSDFYDFTSPLGECATDSFESDAYDVGVPHSAAGWTPADYNTPALENWKEIIESSKPSRAAHLSRGQLTAPLSSNSGDTTLNGADEEVKHSSPDVALRRRSSLPRIEGTGALLSPPAKRHTRNISTPDLASWCTPPAWGTEDEMHGEQEQEWADVVRALAERGPWSGGRPPKRHGFINSSF